MIPENKKPADICERTFLYAVRIVKLCHHLEKQADVSRTLAKQLLRSGTSIGANVEEGRAGCSRPDFINKNVIALKEARETRYWLKLLAASGVMQSSQLSELEKEANELMLILGAIVVSSKKR